MTLVNLPMSTQWSSLNCSSTEDLKGNSKTNMKRVIKDYPSFA